MKYDKLMLCKLSGVSLKIQMSLLWGNLFGTIFLSNSFKQGSKKGALKKDRPTEPVRLPVEVSLIDSLTERVGTYNLYEPQQMGPYPCC